MEWPWGMWTKMPNAQHRSGLALLTGWVLGGHLSRSLIHHLASVWNSPIPGEEADGITVTKLSSSNWLLLRTYYGVGALLGAIRRFFTASLSPGPLRVLYYCLLCLDMEARARALHFQSILKPEVEFEAVYGPFGSSYLSAFDDELYNSSLKVLIFPSRDVQSSVRSHSTW